MKDAVVGFSGSVLCEIYCITAQLIPADEWNQRTGITMAKTSFKSVDEYIALQPETVKGVLQRVRSSIRKALPGAEEVIAYQIPAYKLHGTSVIYFAGWKQHYSLYPATADVVSAFKDELAPYEMSKGTIRSHSPRPYPRS